MVAATHYLFTSCPQRKDDLSGAVRLTSAWYPYRRGGVPGLSPVDPFFFYFGEEKKEGQPLTRCAGAPFSFHYGEKIRQFRMEQDFKDVKLDDLVVKKEE